jgi:hypothetical protein
LAANKTATPDKEKQAISIPPAAIVIGLVMVAGVAGFLYLNRAAQAPPKQPPPLTPEARAYIHNGYLQIVDAEMGANESYLSQQVVEITGKIQNTGDRVLRTVDIYCVFYDRYNQVILRERVPIVSSKAGKLAPGETKPFRLPFDNIPDSWNQAMPQMVIAAIDFS